MRKYLNFAALCGAVVALWSSAASAQSFQDFARAPAPAAAGLPMAAFNPYATAGATLYVCDSKGKLWTVTLGTYKLHLVGSLGVVLTDIAFNPKDGKLWGISFSTFYTINTTTGKATAFGSTKLSDINSLVFNTSGIGYFEGYQSSELYEVNVAKGQYVGIGTTGAYKSAGDLTFYNKALVLAGFTGTLGSSTKETLVQISATNGKVIATVPTDLTGLYGLTTVGGNTLYGFANTGLYHIVPSQSNIKLRTVLLKDFKSQGLSPVNGAAYKGDT